VRRPSLDILPKELICKINDFLKSNQKAQSSLVLTASLFHRIVQVERLAALLLLDVARGKQDEAEIILQYYPELLFKKCEATDFSGRIFTNISPWQYAAWAYDMHMLKMMQKYVLEEEKNKAYHQLDELDIKGTEHGAHYDFSPLMTALQSYVDNYQKTWNYAQCVDYWCKQVGGAQRMVPVHVVNEYCHPDRSFDPVPLFNEDVLPRNMSFYDYINQAHFCWFPLLSSTGVGKSCAVLRADHCNAGASEFCGQRWNGGAADLAAISALCQVRTAEFVDLKQLLLLPSHKTAPARTVTKL
jgi:hypothetical protein